jgi:hypothetical protein
MDSLKIPGAVKPLRLGHTGVSVTEGYEDVIDRDEQTAAGQNARPLGTGIGTSFAGGRRISTLERR